MKNKIIAITTTVKKHIDKQTVNSSFKELTDVGLETFVWEKWPLTRETKPGQLGEKEESESFVSHEQSEVEQFPRQTNSLRTQKTMILEELDGLLEEVEDFLLEEESSLDQELESLSSHEQLELKELVEELEVSVQEL